jgi:hypothetical protein
VLDHVWGFGILLELFVLVRGLFSRNLKRFPYFYSYIVSGTALSLCLILTKSPSSYRRVYWSSQFVTLFIGCGLLLEIFGHVLSAYPGAARFAKRVCAITFVVIFFLGLIYLRLAPAGGLATSEFELERNVRTAQIVFFVALMGAISYYGISLGKNMRGMLYGYGLYLGTSVISLALRAYLGRDFNIVWRVVQPLSFDISLVIWLAALWSYSPNPVPARTVQLETDYETLAASTRDRVNALRSHLGRPIR